MVKWNLYKRTCSLRVKKNEFPRGAAKISIEKIRLFELYFYTAIRYFYNGTK